MRWLPLLLLGCSDPYTEDRLATELRYSGQFTVAEVEQMRLAVADWSAVAPVRVTLVPGGDQISKGTFENDAWRAGTWHGAGTITLDSRVTELRLVFAHELGHYWGLGHSEDPASIMWALTEPPRLPSAADGEALMKAYQ